MRNMSSTTEDSSSPPKVAPRHEIAPKALAPWEDVPVQWRGREFELKQFIQKLSSNEDYFKVDVPGDFLPQPDVMGDPKLKAIAHCALKRDEQLANMRFRLVPTSLTEASFWRIYFYLIDVIRSTHDIHNLKDKLLNLVHTSKLFMKEQSMRKELINEMKMVEASAVELLNLIREYVGQKIGQMLHQQPLAQDVPVMDVKVLDVSPDEISAKSQDVVKVQEMGQVEMQYSTSPKLQDGMVSPKLQDASQVEEEDVAPVKARDVSPVKARDVSPVIQETNSGEKIVAQGEHRSKEEKLQSESAQIHKIEELMRECVERKKKIAFFAAESTDDQCIKDSLSINQLFHTVMKEYERFHELTYRPQEKIRIKSFSPKLLGATHDPPSISNDIQRQKLCVALPTRYQRKNWVLVYSTLEHGISVEIFFHRIKTLGSTSGASESMNPSILLVQTKEGVIFGGYNPESSWDNCDKFYGTGETFVFTFKDNQFRYYPWSKRNKYFVRSTNDGISFGGGSDGKAALHIDGDFASGYSYKCQTFDSEILNEQEEEDFDVYAVELWTFEDSKVCKQEGVQQECKRKMIVFGKEISDYSELQFDE